MTALLAALAAAAVLGGLLLVAVGLRPVPVGEVAGRPRSARAGAAAPPAGRHRWRTAPGLGAAGCCWCWLWPAGCWAGW